MLELIKNNSTRVSQNKFDFVVESAGLKPDPELINDKGATIQEFLLLVGGMITIPKAYVVIKDNKKWFFIDSCFLNINSEFLKEIRSKK